MTVRLTPLALLSILLASLTLADEPAEVHGPVSAEDSLRHLVLADEELAIELAAAEPEVIDPVAIKFDEDGRMWVAEMRDYPVGPKSGGKPMSQIKILEDKDGDGRFETARVFADELLFVTGIQPWQGGAIVTLSGRVAYMKDTDGDGRADVDETWFTGFAEQNPQLRANHPTFALDNWVYVANGLRGGKVVNHMKAKGQRSEVRSQKAENPQSAIRNPQSEIPLSGMDFRFNPFTGEAEAVSGNGQFGLTFDDWGNRFICSNRNPCMHVVIENRYLQRAPNVAIPAVVQDVAAAGENSRIYPLTRAWTTSNLHAGQFTAACGVFIYRGNLLPSLRGNVFTCDPTGNLIHREIMKEKGPTFESKPAYDGKEFLASRDEWFRPVSMQLGPDGALYVVDMYRAVIEHPEWVPDELKNRPDERYGDDRGRIYRIVPKVSIAKRERGPFPRLSEFASADLVKLLASDNAWQRDTAQRLLVQRGDHSVAPRLETIAVDDASPTTRVQAAWTLAGVGATPWKPAANLLASKNELARRAGVQLADTTLAGKPVSADTLNISDLMIANLTHRSPAVRFYAMQGHRLVSSPTDLAITKLAIQSSADPWMRRAFLLSGYGAEESLEELFDLSVDQAEPIAASHLELVGEFALQLGSVESPLEGAALRILTSRLPSKAKRTVGLVGLEAMARGYLRRRMRLTGRLTSAGLDQRVKSLMAATVAMATDAKETERSRLVAIGLLKFLPESTKTLENLTASGDDRTRAEAIKSLASHDDALETWSELVGHFATQPPAIRPAIFDGAVQRPERVALLLDAMEAGTIRPTEIDRVQTDRLLKHGDVKIRQRAAKIFGSALPEDRKKALADYQSVLSMQADAARGKQVFAKNCATCHKIGEIGVNVAPDISDSRTKTPAQILGDIIQPNRAIDANYIAWNVLLSDGSAASGVLSAETGTSITLRQPEGKTLVVSRSDIEQLKSSGLSLMPEGLEKNIPKQEMADLISFIKNWRYLDGRTPLGK